MSFRSLRLPAVMAGAAAAVVSFATPSLAWRSHARHYYRTTHHVVVYRAVYRPAPSYAWAPGAIIVNILGGVEPAAPDTIGAAGALAGGSYNCAYGSPSAANPEAYCPPYGYYAPGYGYPGPR